MSQEPYKLEHLHALLADRALQGADSAEEAALRCLLQHEPTLDAESFDRAAAALDLALQQGHEEGMPAHLLEKLQAQAASLKPDLQTDKAVIQPAVVSPTPKVNRRFAIATAVAWSGWLVAAVVLLAMWLPSSPKMLSVDQLKQQDALVVRGELGKNGKPGLKGDFIWDSKTQQGYMKLAGFDVNNPDKSQYQLWIFDDKDFTTKTPIDGGVFNITSKNEVLIPIKPNLKVGKPHLFAITIERPGGVMKSERENLIFMGLVPDKSKS